MAVGVKCHRESLRKKLRGDGSSSMAAKLYKGKLSGLRTAKRCVWSDDTFKVEL